MLEDIKNKINQNAKGISNEINNSASAASKMAKSKADSVVLGLATKIIVSSMNGIASKGFSYITCWRYFNPLNFFKKQFQFRIIQSHYLDLLHV